MDTGVDLVDVVHRPVDILDALNPPGIAPHNLCLNTGAPIILLRNLIRPKLNTNSTRLQVNALRKNVTEVTIFTGGVTGGTVVLPRIHLIPSDYHVQFKRLKFPVKVRLAVTINKTRVFNSSRNGF